LQNAYKSAVIYFLLFCVLLLISGATLFFVKIGFDAKSVSAYYLGSAEMFVSAKTTMGILKIILPHIFVFGLFSMVILHFVVFTEYKHKRQMLALIYLTYLLSFIELFSPLLILQGIELFAYVKLFSFFALEILFFYLFFILFKSIVYN